jgi:WD40 repeat protein
MPEHIRKSRNRIGFVILLICLQLGLGMPILKADAQQPSTQISAAVSNFFDVSWHPNGQLIAAASSKGVKLYNIHLQEISTLHSHVGNVGAIAWSSDGLQLATSGDVDDNVIRIWDFDPSTNVFTLHTTILDQNQYKFFARLRWSPDGTKLAIIGVNDPYQTGDLLGGIEIWDTTTWTTIKVITDQLNPGLTLEWSPNSERLLLATNDGTSQYVIDVYDLVQNKVIFDPLYIDSPSASFIDDDLLAITTSTNTIEIRDIGSGEVVNSLSPFDTAFVVAHPASKKLAALSGTTDSGIGTGEIVDLPTGSILLNIQTAAQLRSIMWSPNGDYLAAVTFNGTIQLWDMTNLPNPHNSPTLAPILATLTPDAI